MIEPITDVSDKIVFLIEQTLGKGAAWTRKRWLVASVRCNMPTLHAHSEFRGRAESYVTGNRVLIDLSQLFPNHARWLGEDTLRHYTPAEQRRGLERLAADVEGNGWDHIDTSHD